MCATVIIVLFKKNSSKYWHQMTPFSPQHTHTMIGHDSKDYLVLEAFLKEAHVS